MSRWGLMTDYSSAYTTNRNFHLKIHQIIQKFQEHFNNKQIEGFFLNNILISIRAFQKKISVLNNFKIFRKSIIPQFYQLTYILKNRSIL